LPQTRDCSCDGLLSHLSDSLEWAFDYCLLVQGKLLSGIAMKEAHDFATWWDFFSAWHKSTPTSAQFYSNKTREMIPRKAVSVAWGSGIPVVLMIPDLAFVAKNRAVQIKASFPTQDLQKRSNRVHCPLSTLWRFLCLAVIRVHPFIGSQQCFRLDFSCFRSRSSPTIPDSRKPNQNFRPIWERETNRNERCAWFCNETAPEMET
jgi:hypothetical protein